MGGITNQPPNPNDPEDYERYKKDSRGFLVTFIEVDDIGEGHINEYLGSFGGNDTFALAVFEQDNTTGEILQNPNLYKPVEMAQTITRAGVGSFPDSSWLKQNKGNKQGAEGDTSGQGEMEEFSTDLNAELVSFSSEMVSIFGVETDGYEVTFTIGIPLYSKDSGGQTGSATNTFDDTKETASKIKDFIKTIKNAGASKDSFKRAFSNLAGEDLDANNLKSKSIEFTVNITLAITIKYNPLDNTYKFSEAAIALGAELEIRLQYRFTLVPVVYVYAQFGAEASVAVGLGQDRLPVYGKAIVPSGTVDEVDLYELPGKNSYYFSTDVKAFRITFSGKLYMECYEFEDTDGDGEYDEGTDVILQTLSGFNPGYIRSDGEEPVEIILKGQKGFKLDKPVVVVLTVTDDNNDKNVATAKITDITLIEDVRSEIYFSGFKLELEGSIELGLGVGIEILKAELFAKVSIGAAFSLVSRDDGGQQNIASIDEFSLVGAIGFRIVLLFFNYEMDLAEYHLTYENGEGWSHGWSALGGAFGEDYEIGTEGIGDGGKTDVYITPPSIVKARVYDNNVTYRNGDLDDMAYDVPGVEFQVSGYGSSVNAYKLVDGVRTGYDYMIVTVGDENYVVYTGTRDAEGIEGVDNTQLMLSKLKVTRTDEKDVYGFVNPIAGNSMDPVTAIPVDNDEAGDLDFYAWAEGSNIHVVWVSYKEKSTKPERPDGDPYTFNGAEMNEKNYLTIGKPAGGTYDPEAGTFTGEGACLVIGETAVNRDNYKTLSIDPVAEPDENDYYRTIPPDPLDGWDSVTIENEDGTEVTYYYPDTYESLDEAKTAYGADRSKYYAYQQAKICLDNWIKYYEWYNYYRSFDPQNRIVDASCNTVVKHAVFDTASTDKNTKFTEPAILSAETGKYCFLPQAAGEAVIFAQSVPYTESELNEQLQKYKDYLEATVQMPQNVAGDPDTTLKYINTAKAYRLAYQQSLMSIYGGNSRLTVAGPGGEAYADGVMYVSRHQEDGNGNPVDQTDEILTNIALTEIDGTYYLSYVTQQDIFEKDGDEYKDLITISRLYLRTFSITDNEDTGGGGPAKKVVWGNPLLLRTIVNSEQDNTKDGEYNSSLVMKKAYTDPYIANLKFLRGILGDKLGNAAEEEFEVFGDEGPETFLLFEMNGNTYVINQASLERITTEGKGTIYPFFTYEQLYGSALEEGSNRNLSSGKSEVVIGADGDGNIAAVYISSVPNTVNNAIFISYWDPEAGAWSSGVMLAMNYMDVYEKSIAEGWDPQKTEAAYFDEEFGGGLTSFTFSNLQFALGRKKTDNGGTETQALETLEEGNLVAITASSPESQFAGLAAKLGLPEDPEEIQALANTYTKAKLYALQEQAELLGYDTGSKAADTPELLILTQGLLQELQIYEEEDGRKVIAPKRDKDTNRPVPGQLGLYVISYGKGNQQVGNVSIRFSFNEFTVGSRLHAMVSFQNVGDAAIRGSENQPITVKLMLNDDGKITKMADWLITEMIGAGQTVRLSTSETPCEPLDASLDEGDYFYITVSESEGEGYAGDPYNYDSSSDERFKYTYEIDNKPDLGIERLKASVVDVDNNGDAVIEVSFDVTNRGSLEAEEVFVQFSYADGYDENGNVAYKPLDISDSNLYVSQQKLITETLEPLSDDQLKKGIIYLGTDPTFYTDDYYITEEQYNDILRQYYIPDENYQYPPADGWEKGFYNGNWYWYNKRYYISAYAAIMAAQEAVKGWSYGGERNGKVYYYNNTYSSLDEAWAKADEARKAEYIITTEAYNALPEAEKGKWQYSDREGGCYYIKAFGSYEEAWDAYQSALSDATQGIKSSYCRTVKGTIKVSPGHFRGNVTESLNIRVEVFSRSSDMTINASGLRSSEHKDEYYAANNKAEVQLEQTTFISAPARITLAQNSIHRIPVSIRTTTGKAPEIRVLEVEDGADELGTLYYSADDDRDGVPSTATGSVVVAGTREGGGVIHVIDTVTNTTCAIAYTVAEASAGTNIFNDDAQFTFYNKDGTPYNENEQNQSWKFQALNEWTNKRVQPYLRDIAIGEKDAYFTFETKARRISFDMIGSATVTSNKFPGTFTVSHDGTLEDTPPGVQPPAAPTTSWIDFGNDVGLSHVVTVRITSDMAYFDIVRLTYGENYTPSDDIASPGIYWSRSFPTTGSIQSGDSVQFTVYALDDSGLQSFRFNDRSLSDSEVTKIAAGLWSYTFSVNSNGSFTVSATDTNGNTTSRRVEVDWFVDKPSDAAKPRGLRPKLENVTAFKVNPDGTEQNIFGEPPVVVTEEEREKCKVYLYGETDEGCELSYYSFNRDVNTFTALEENPKPYVTENGYYMVRSDELNFRTWSAKILYINCFEPTPTISVIQTQLLSPNGYRLEWAARKDESSTAKLDSITLNGIDVARGIGATTYSGTNTVLYGGQYEFRVTDTRGVTGTRMINLKVPVDISNRDAITYVNPWSQPVNGFAGHGSVTVDFSKITGGEYTAESKKDAKSLDDYRGRYEAVLLSEEEYKDKPLPGPGTGLVDGQDCWLTQEVHGWKKFEHDEIYSWEGLKARENGEGKYMLIIRDALNPSSYSTMASREIILHDNSIDCVSISSRMASSSSAADGEIYVTANRGLKGGYEFAVLPVEIDTENSTDTDIVYKTRTVDDFKSSGVKWQLADWNSVNFNEATLSGLAPGRYQVAIRSFVTGDKQEMEKLSELSILGVEPENLAREVEAIKDEIEANTNVMINDISTKSNEWHNASNNASALKEEYDDLRRRLERGDKNVTNRDVDEAYDRWQVALVEEESARMAYRDAFTGATEEQKDYFETLRSNWLSAATLEEKRNTRKIYEKAVSEYCHDYWENQKSSELAEAVSRYNTAKGYFDSKAEELGTMSAGEYQNDERYWDGLLTGEALQVTIRSGEGTSLKATPTNSSSTSATGKITVTAYGGSAYDGGDTVHYQFAVLPLENETDAVDYSGNMAEIGNLRLDWHFADDPATDHRTASFTGLPSGWYQVFVRPVYDDDLRDGYDVNTNLYDPSGTITDYASIKKAYDDAVAAAQPEAVEQKAEAVHQLFLNYQSSNLDADWDAFLAAINSDQTVLDALDEWLNTSDQAEKMAAYENYRQVLFNYFKAVADGGLDTASTNYATKLAELKKHVEDAYSKSPGYYGTASFATVYVDTVRQASGNIGRPISEENISYGDGEVTYMIEEGSMLLPSDCRRILEDNSSLRTILVIGSRRVVIPAGMLRSEDEVAELLTNFEDGTGNVVEYTDPDGNTRIIPIAISQDGEVAYMYCGPGTYRLIESSAPSFSDTEGHWANESISFVTASGLFNGVGEDRFGPNWTMTRAMLATVLYRMIGQPEPGDSPKFEDVADDTWYGDAVAWAYSNGIAGGVGENRFAPNRAITRAELVTMLYRFMKAYGFIRDENTALDGYPDAENIPAYAWESFEWAVSAGIISGNDKGLLMPMSNATRAQVATVFERLIRYMLK